LRDAVDSVYLQDVELIIVNDGSTDDSRVVIDNLVSGWIITGKKAVAVHLPQNKGMAVARNEGLKAATGDLIVFLDADDMRTDGSILKQVEYFKAHPETMVVWGWALELREDIGYEAATKIAGKLRWHTAEVNPQTVMYRREVFQKYGGFYEELTSGTDKEMCMRLGLHPDSPFKGRLASKKLKVPLAFYHKHEGQIHKLRKADPAWAKETKRMQKDRIKMLLHNGITKKNTRFPI
jgi:glycosyltransferase involved in cell wall biosynthesis